MGVNHGGADIGMAQQFLHGADVVTRQQQMGGKRVPQSVGRGGFGNIGQLQGPLERPLEGLLVLVMPALAGTTRVGRQHGLREDPEPRPRQSGTLVLAGQRVRQVHTRHAGSAVR